MMTLLGQTTTTPPAPATGPAAASTPTTAPTGANAAATATNTAEATQQAAPTMPDWMVWIIDHRLIIILVLVIAVLAGVIIFGQLRRMHRRRKLSRKTQELEKDLLLRKEISQIVTGGRKAEKSEAQALAPRLNDLRILMRQGVNRFHSANKNVNDVPWYLLIGEPGSGKSTVMRNSGLDFPADVNDLSQGQNGTDSMHWWIMNNGVVLDVAGRILFSRWGGESDAEWREFSRLLKRMRKPLPVNGIVVAIPADSLLADTATNIRKKANLITEQIQNLQSILGLYLPVYVVITKIDMINGMHALFDTVAEDQRNQIFGWSNTSEDGRYDFASLSAFFDDLRKQVSVLRDRVALDPRYWDPAEESREKYMGKIYDLPDALPQLCKQLNQYLEPIFAQSNWSRQASLMLRGVYMTSATDQGQAYDLLGAQAVDKSAEEMRVGHHADARRSLFIRDVFDSKVFAEPGLARVNPRAKRRRSRPLIAAAAVVAFIAIVWGTFTGLGFDRLQSEVADATPQYTKITNMMARNHFDAAPLFGKSKDGQYVSYLQEPMPGDSKVSRQNYLAEFALIASERIPVPEAYRVTMPSEGTLQDNLMVNQRLVAYEAVFARMAFSPLMQLACDKFIHMNDRGPLVWDDDATDSLLTLMRLNDEIQNATQINDLLINHELANHDLRALVRFVFPDQAPALLASVFADTPAAKGRGSAFLQSAQGGSSNFLLPIYPDSNLVSWEAISRGIEEFEQAWKVGLKDNSEFVRLRELSDAITAFSKTEDQLRQIANQVDQHGKAPWTPDEAQALIKQWQEQRQNLRGDKTRIDNALAALPNGLLYELDKNLEQASRRYLDRMRSQFKEISKFLEANSGANAAPRKYQEWIDNLDDSIKRASVSTEQAISGQIAQVNQVLKSSVDTYLKASDPNLPAPYVARFDVYNSFSATDQHDAAVHDIQDLNANLASIKNDVTKAKSSIRVLSQEYAKTPYMAQVAKRCDLMLDLVERTQNYQVVTQSVVNMPETNEALQDVIRDMAKDQLPIYLPAIPLTRSPQAQQADTAYHPQAVATYVAEFDLAKQLIAQNSKSQTPPKQTDPKNKNQQQPPPMLEADAFKPQVQRGERLVSDYLNQYVDYWSENINQFAAVKRYNTYEEFHAAIQQVKAFQVNGSLYTLTNLQIDALEKNKGMSEEAKKVATAATANAQSTATVLTPIFNNLCEETLLEWQAMPAQAQDARQAILTMSKKKMMSTLFRPYSTNPQANVNWWNEFIDEGLKALGRDTREIVQSKTLKVSRSYRGFPAMKPPANANLPVLTQDDVNQMHNDLVQILGAPDVLTTSSTPGAAGTSAAGGAAGAAASQAPAADATKKAATAKPAVGLPASLIDITGEAALSSIPQRTWLEQTQAVSQALQSADQQPLTWTLAIADAENLKRMPVTSLPAWTLVPGQDRLRFMETYVAGEMLGTRIETATSDGKSKLLEDVTAAASARDIEFRFYRWSNSKEPDAVVKFDGPWAVLRLYLRAGVTYDAKSKTYFVPVVFPDKQSDNIRYCMALSFSRPMPLPDTWPSIANWPLDSPSDDVVPPAPKEPAATQPEAKPTDTKPTDTTPQPQPPAADTKPSAATAPAQPAAASSTTLQSTTDVKPAAESQPAEAQPTPQTLPGGITEITEPASTTK